MIVKNVRDLQPQIPSHEHSVIYDYENGEKICKLCGKVVQDKLYDTELDIDFYNHTNTVLPRSIILNVNGMSTAIADYNTKGLKFSLFSKLLPTSLSRSSKEKGTIFLVLQFLPHHL